MSNNSLKQECELCRYFKEFETPKVLEDGTLLYGRCCAYIEREKYLNGRLVTIIEESRLRIDNLHHECGVGKFKRSYKK